MKTKYTEPNEYIPNKIRKELKLGEFAEGTEAEEKEQNQKEQRRNHL